MANPSATTNQQHFLTQPIPRERLDGLSEVRRSQERPLVSLQTTRVDSSSTEKKDAGVYRSRRAIPFSAAPCDSPQASAPPRAGEEAASPLNRSPKCPQQRSGNDWEEGRKWLRRHGTSYFRRGGRAGVRLLPEAPVCRVPRWRRGCTWSTTWTVRAAGAGPRAAAEDGRADCASGRGLSPAWALAEPRLPRAPRTAALPDAWL